MPVNTIRQTDLSKTVRALRKLGEKIESVKISDGIITVQIADAGKKATTAERLSIKEACDYIPCGKTTLYELFQDGTLTAIKVRGLTFIKRQQIDKWLANKALQGVRQNGHHSAMAKKRKKKAVR